MSNNNSEDAIDLSYLYEISGNDQEFVDEILGTLIANLPEMLQDLQESLSKADLTMMAKVVHKVKPSVLLLNIEKLNAMLKEVEKNLKGEQNIQTLEEQIPELIACCKGVVDKVKTML